MHPKALIAVIAGMASLTIGSPLRENRKSRWENSVRSHKAHHTSDAIARAVESSENRDYSDYTSEKRGVESSQNRDYSDLDVKRAVESTQNRNYGDVDVKERAVESTQNRDYSDVDVKKRAVESTQNRDYSDVE